MRNQTKGDLTESEEVLTDLEGQMEATRQKFEAEIQDVNERWAKLIPPLSVPPSSITRTVITAEPVWPATGVKVIEPVALGLV